MNLQKSDHIDYKGHKPYEQKQIKSQYGFFNDIQKKDLLLWITYKKYWKSFDVQIKSNNNTSINIKFYQIIQDNKFSQFIQQKFNSITNHSQGNLNKTFNINTKNNSLVQIFKCSFIMNFALEIIVIYKIINKLNLSQVMIQQSNVHIYQSFHQYLVKNFQQIIKINPLLKHFIEILKWLQFQTNQDNQTLFDNFNVYIKALLFSYQKILKNNVMQSESVNTKDYQIILQFKQIQNKPFNNQALIKLELLLNKFIQKKINLNQTNITLNDHQLQFHRNSYIYLFKNIKTKIINFKNQNIDINYAYIIKILEKFSISVVKFFQQYTILNPQDSYQEQILDLIFDINDLSFLVSYFIQNNIHKRNKLNSKINSIGKACPTLQRYFYKKNILSIIPILFYRTSLYFNNKEQKIKSLSLINRAQIKRLIIKKDNLIYQLLSHNLAEVSYQILNYFLTQSGFQIKSKVGQLKRRKHSQQTSLFQHSNSSKQLINFIDPLHFLMLKKQFWMNQFYSQLLSICLWVISEFWLLHIKKKINANTKKTFQQNKTDFEQFEKIQLIVISQFILSLPLSLNNTLLNYYFMQNKNMKQISNVSSFASIILSFKNILQLSWSKNLIEEMPRLIYQQNGYLLAEKIYKSKNSYKGYIVDLVINAIQQEIRSQRYISQKKRQDIINILKIFNLSEKNQKVQTKTKIEQLILYFNQ